jgi:hypothetical protein
MMMQMVAKQNSVNKAYNWNKSVVVRPCTIAIATVILADDYDFTGRLGHLEPNKGRLRS